MKIKWINQNPGAQADECGYWQSDDGRFDIAPNYRHTVYPDSYELYDNLTKRKMSWDRVRECKQHALRIIEREAYAKSNSF